MRSDPRVAAALAALAPRLQAYRAALADVVERTDRYLNAASAEVPSRRVAAELGTFAESRIDAERFAELLVGAPALDQAQRAMLAHACSIMRAVVAAPDTDFVVDVPSGERPGASIGDRLAELGRAFDAAQMTERVKSHRADGDAMATPRALHQSRWNRVERATPPPLVVLVDGADLWAAEVAPFLDGRQAIVFVVRGVCPPAPLARLITPSVFVLQTSRSEGLASVQSAEGPAAAALVPEGCAEFVHTPANAVVHERLSVRVTPEPPRRAIGAWSARQQQDDLQLLLELSTPGVTRPKAIPGAPTASSADPVEQLAGWLLSQAAG